MADDINICSGQAVSQLGDPCPPTQFVALGDINNGSEVPVAPPWPRARQGRLTFQLTGRCMVCPRCMPGGLHPDRGRCNPPAYWAREQGN